MDPAKVLKAASWFKSIQSQNKNQGSSCPPSSGYLPFAIEVSQMSEVLLLHCLKFNSDFILHTRVMAKKSNASSCPLALSRAKQLSSVKKTPLLRILSQSTNKVLFSHKKKKKEKRVLLFYISYSRKRLTWYLPAAVSDCHAPASCLKCLGYRDSREVL